MNYHHLADTDPIRYHEEAISALQKNAKELDERKLKHIKQGAGGRLNVDDTEKMSHVTKAQIKGHQERLALSKHYDGEPLVMPE